MLKVHCVVVEGKSLLLPPTKGDTLQLERLFSQICRLPPLKRGNQFPLPVRKPISRAKFRVAAAASRLP